MSVVFFFLRAATFDASISVVAKTAQPILLEIPKCFWYGVNMLQTKKFNSILVIKFASQEIDFILA